MQRSRLIAPLLSAALTVSLLGACSSTPKRTAANFCATYVKDKTRYLQRYNAQASAVSRTQQNDPLAGLFGLAGMSAEMLGSVENLFADLAKVAPEDIQTQVEQVRDSVRKQEDLFGGENPLSGKSILGALLGSVLAGLETSDSWQQVGTYIQQNCHTN